MYREARRQLRGLRVYLLARGLRASILGASVTFLVIGAGCSAIPEDLLNAPGAETPDAGGDGAADDGDALVTASGTDTGTAAALVIAAAPIFCCDPLTIDLMANGDGSDLARARFEWDLGTGHVLVGPTIRHTFPWAGTYTVKLRAVFPDGSTLDTQRDIRVGTGEGETADGDATVEPSEIVGPMPDDGSTTADTPAVLFAHAGPDREVQAGETVLLDGTQSKGTTPRSLRYYWKQSEGPRVPLQRNQAATTSFVAPEAVEDAVELAFELVVTEQNTLATDSVRITVMPNPRPVVVADAGDGQTVPGGWVVQLDGGDSRSTSSQPMSFSWRQLSGPTVDLGSPGEISTSFVAPPDGETPIELVFELTVSVGSLLSRDTVTVVVQRPADSGLSYNEKVLAWLQALDPLPKVHITWPLQRADMQGIDDELLFEYARITHSLSINAEYADQEYMRKIVATCQRVNEMNPERPCTLSALMRPWMRLFPVDAPVTYRGPEHFAEIQFAVDQLENTKAHLAKANQDLGASVELTCIFLDVERFFVRAEDEPDAEGWNTALDEKYDVIYDVIKAALPDVRVEWYGRAISGLFTFREKGDSFSVPLYHVNERDTTRRIYWRAYREAVLHNVSEVTPWVALGTAYQRLPDGEKVWSFENIYDVSISWQLGAEINDPWYGDRANQFAPYHAATHIIFWPHAFDDRVPDWGRHFVAYVRGAHGITEIPR